VDERHDIYEGDRLHVWRCGGAVIIAGFIHGFILLLLSAAPSVKLAPLIAPPLSVEIVERAAGQPKPPPQLNPSLTKPPVSKSSASKPPISEPNPEPNPDPSPPPSPARPVIDPSANIAPPSTPKAIPNIIAGPQTEDDDDTDSTVYIPSRWALEPALSKDRLEGLFGEGFQKDVNCIRSLSEDCTSLRKEVFADYQLSEQDLIWTESFAHSGLTNPELHGLSEYDIRKKIGAPIAGDNAFVILPGIAIDGNFWDSLHGVNKKCPVYRGIRRCPPLKPKADDKRFHIPKKDSP